MADMVHGSSREPGLLTVAGQRQPVVLSFSGGKDSLLALARLAADPDWQVVRLLTTLNESYQRIAMHGVRRSLLEAQASSLGLPLDLVFLPVHGGNAEYEAALGHRLMEYRENGIHHVAFGDLFLEEVRRYRETHLAQVDMTGLFPLWGQPTDRLARRFIAEGYRAIVVCVDTTQLDPSFAGREFDDRFLADLPVTVDPCGERGEFHSFVYDGPPFIHPVMFQRGETVLRDQRFQYCELHPWPFNPPSADARSGGRLR